MRRFGYRLALALGRADVDELLEEMPRSALLEWSAYHELEPWGEDRDDARSAIVAATIANLWRRRGAAPRKVRDFLAYRAPPQPMSREKALRFRDIMLEVNRAHGDKPQRPADG